MGVSLVRTGCILILSFMWAWPMLWLLNKIDPARSPLGVFSYLSCVVSLACVLFGWWYITWDERRKRIERMQADGLNEDQIKRHINYDKRKL